jgi:hypothetical protein
MENMEREIEEDQSRLLSTTETMSKQCDGRTIT